MSMAFMNSMSMVTVQTLGLQQMRREAAYESAPKALFLQRQRENVVAPCTSKLLLTIVDWCHLQGDWGLSSTIPCLRGHY